jgi:long-chain acyl-CoA synthetase
MREATSLVALLAERAQRRPRARVALDKRFGVWRPTTAGELAERVVRVAAGLQRAGVAPGDAVVVAGDPTLGWLVADLAVQTVGAVSVAAYPTQTAADLEALLAGVRVRVGFCDDEPQAALLAGAGVETIVALDPRYDLIPPADPRVRTLAAFGATPGEDETWAAMAAALRPDDAAAGAVSAGRADAPRTAVFSHAAVLAAARAAARALQLTGRDVTLAHVPPAQVRVLDLYAPLVAGSTLGFCESRATVEADLRELRPTVLVTVARALELLHARAAHRATTNRRFKRAVLRWADAGRGPAGSRNAVAHTLVDRFVVRRLGLDRARAVAVCGPPVSPSVQGLFTGLGVPLRSVYGQAESLGLVTIGDAPARGAAAAAQAPLPGVRVAVGAAGELLVAGDWIAGRLLDGSACAGPDGVPTGDRGAIDDAGGVVVLGAAHDVAHGPEGEALELCAVEARLNASPFVRRSVVLPTSDGRLAALVELERATVAPWAAARGVAAADYAGLAAAPEVRELVDAVCAEANAELAAGQQIAAGAVLPRPLDSEPAAPIAPTLAVRRRVVRALHRELVEAPAPAAG